MREFEPQIFRLEKLGSAAWAIRHLVAIRCCHRFYVKWLNWLLNSFKTALYMFLFFLFQIQTLAYTLTALYMFSFVSKFKLSKGERGSVVEQSPTSSALLFESYVVDLMM